MRELLTHGLAAGLTFALVGGGGGEPAGEATPEEDVTAQMTEVSIVFSGPSGEADELFSLDLSDNSRNQLTIMSGNLGFPVWSPVGNRIAFTMMTAESADLMALDFVSGEVSTLIAGYGNLADWGPHGERLLIVRDGNNAGLFIFDLASGTEERVQTGSSADAYARWARNGEAIVYESGRDGNPEIYLTWLASGETLRLTDNDHLDEWPSPSHDASQIAWASGTEEDKNLWVMRSDGSEKRQVTRGMLFGDAFPEWSPDGSQILLTVNENDAFVLKLLDLASGKVTDLGPGSAASWR